MRRDAGDRLRSVRHSSVRAPRVVPEGAGAAAPPSPLRKHESPFRGVTRNYCHRHGDRRRPSVPQRGGRASVAAFADAVRLPADRGRQRHHRRLGDDRRRPRRHRGPRGPPGVRRRLPRRAARREERGRLLHGRRRLPGPGRPADRLGPRAGRRRGPRPRPPPPDRAGCLAAARAGRERRARIRPAPPLWRAHPGHRPDAGGAARGPAEPANRGPSLRLSAGDRRPGRGGGLDHPRDRRALPLADGQVEGHRDRTGDHADRQGHAEGAGIMIDLAAQVLVIAKAPVPGRVKTRLIPPFTPYEAAALAKASLGDTLESVRRTRVIRRVVALAGEPGPWLPDGFDVIPQRGGGLDERIAAAMWDAYAALPVPIVLIGMDTPQVTPGLLEAAAEPLVHAAADATFGPAEDGGFWMLGLRKPEPELVLGVPMSEPFTGRAQLVRLIQAELRIHMAPELVDVDTIAEAARVARQAPASRFAAKLAETLGAPAQVDEAVFALK